MIRSSKRGDWQTVAVVVAGRVGASLSAALLTIVVARYASTDVLAGFSLTASAVLLIGIACQLGLPQSVIRQIASARLSGDAAHVGAAGLSAVLLSSVVGSLLAAVAASAWTYLAGPSSLTQLVTPASGLWLFCHSAVAYAAELHRAHGRVQAATVVGSVLPNGLALMYVVLGALQQVPLSLDALTWVHAASFGVALLASVISLTKARTLPRRVLVLPRLGAEWRRRAVNNLLITGCSALTLQANMIVIGALGTAGETARYAVASRLIGIMGIVSVLMSQIFSPRIATLAARDDRAGLQALARRICRLSVASAALPALLLVSAPELALRWLFGDRYTGAASFVVPMAAAFAVNAVTGLRGQFLIQTKNDAALRTLTVVTGLASVTVVFAACQVGGVQAGVVAASVLLVALSLAEFGLLKRLTGVVSAPWKGAPA